MPWSPSDTWIAVGVEICHLYVPSFRDRQYRRRGSATTTVLTAFRTTLSPNRIPPPMVIAAHAAAMGRLACNWRRLREDSCLSLRFATCPGSFLAGLRVGRLIGVKWRAVIHDATVPLHGQAGAGRPG